MNIAKIYEVNGIMTYSMSNATQSGGKLLQVLPQARLGGITGASALAIACRTDT